MTNTNNYKYYETYVKLENGKWHFVGIDKYENGVEDNCFEKFCIETKIARGFIYKTYKFLNGNIDYYKYRYIAD